MKLKLDGVVLYLGKTRKDGYRNVERVRLPDNRSLLPKLRRAKIKGKRIGKRLIVQTENPNQLKMAFMAEAV